MDVVFVSFWQTSPDAAPVYEMWPDSPQIMPCIKFNQDLQDDGHQHRNG